MHIKPLQVVFRPRMSKGNSQAEAGNLFHSPERDPLASVISDREESVTHEKCSEVNHTLLSIASAG